MSTDFLTFVEPKTEHQRTYLELYRTRNLPNPIFHRYASDVVIDIFKNRPTSVQLTLANFKPLLDELFGTNSGVAFQDFSQIVFIGYVFRLSEEININSNTLGKARSILSAEQLVIGLQESFGGYNPMAGMIFANSIRNAIIQKMQISKNYSKLLSADQELVENQIYLSLICGHLLGELEHQNLR